MADRNQLFDLSGDKELVRKLSKLARKDFSKATRQGSNARMRATRANAPVDTGTLKRAIKTQSIKSRKAVGHKVVVFFKGGSANNLFYAGFQEYGFTHMGGMRIEKNKEYMLKASKKEGPKALQTTVDILKQAVLGEVK